MAPAPPFENRYTRGDCKTQKTCWLCRNTTMICLMTKDYATNGDFFYSCASHLKDTSFATPIVAKPSSPGKSTVAQADIDQAVKDYQERQKAREEKQTEAPKSGDGEEEKNKTKDASKKDSSIKSWTAWLMEGSSAPPAKDEQMPAQHAPEPTQFELRQDFFNMRLRLNQQKKYAKDAAARQAQLNFPAIPQQPPMTNPVGKQK